jgi:GNAT superfamily N-acetyltransferase
MKRNPGRINRVLAIAPTSRGFGYAVLELADDRLIDSGLRQVVPAEMEQRALPKVAELIEYFSPHAVIVEDTRHPRCRRRGRGRALIGGIIEVAETMHVAVGRVPAIRVREHYRNLGARNKSAIAALIAERFPELRPVLPPPRKIWMSPNERMTIFDSIAFATVFAFGRAGARRQP